MRAVLLVALVAVLGGAALAITQINKGSAPAQQPTTVVSPENYPSSAAAPAAQQTAAPIQAPQAVESNVATSQPQIAEQYPAAIEENVVQTTYAAAPPIIVQVEPPPMPIYVVPPPPSPNYAWVPGHWMWNGNGYYWIPGTWVSPPAPRVLWTPGYWAWNAGLFVWHVGYWGPHIGFYGGVHYGGGYDGAGFSGGEWRDNTYIVNRSVTNVTNIRNVTNTTNIINVTNITNETASFNGGPRGVQAQPTPQQEAALHEQHVAPPAEQIQHMQAARMNESLRASANGGKPPMTVTAAPLKAQQSNAAAPRQAEPNRPVERPASVERPENQPQKNPETIRKEKMPSPASPPKVEERRPPNPPMQEDEVHSPSRNIGSEPSNQKTIMAQPKTAETHSVPADAKTDLQKERQKTPPVQLQENKPEVAKSETQTGTSTPSNKKDKSITPQEKVQKTKPPEDKRPDERDRQEQEHSKNQ